MCGIVGYIGKQTAAPLLLEGLRRLEYRGYDSAGLCTLFNGVLEVRKCVGRVSRLEELVARQPANGCTGISHTRWATHGLPSDANAHPHLDRSGQLALVHNGIIENYAALRRRLLKDHHKFLSQTDTEVLAHLVGHHLDRRLARGRPLTPALLADAVLAATREATGTYAIAIVHAELPGHVLGARRGSPLVVGLGQAENFLASDVSPIVAHTRKIIYLHDGDVVVLGPDEALIWAGGKAVRRPVSTVDWTAEAAERGAFPHYMLKEIHEQPQRVAEVLGRVLRPEAGAVAFEEAALGPRQLGWVRRLLLVACGTSWHAALAGEYLIESLARLPVEVECASEMRYRHRPIEPHTLVIPISQSGETADTLAALRGARAQGARTLALVNVAGSTIARESDADIQMRAGPEIGVASTKAFELQLLWLTLLGLALGRQRGCLSPAAARKLARELDRIPAKLRQVLATDSSILEEIKARKGPIIAVATAGDPEIALEADALLRVPPTLDCLQPLLTVVPLQLLAYHIAVLRGCDVDRPRNLAKSVTVE